MKKILAFVMAVATISASSVASVNAVRYNKPKFENEFKSYIEEIAGSSAYCGDYNEKYYHYDENGNIDWCLISASLSTDPGICHGIFDDIIISNAGSTNPFSFGLAVYDVTNNEYYDICYAWDMDFADLHNSFYNVMLDENSSYSYGNVVVLGDVDGNGKLDINDTTLIQKTIADNNTVIFSLDFEHSELKYGKPIKNLCDYNKDGVCSVSDVTSLQLKLAKG